MDVAQHCTNERHFESELTLGAEEDTALGTALKSLVELSGEGSLADVGDARVVGQKVLLDSLTAVEKTRSVQKSDQVASHRSSAAKLGNDGDDNGNDLITYLDPPRSLSCSGEHVSTKFQTIRTMRAGAIVTRNLLCRNPGDGRAGRARGLLLRRMFRTHLKDSLLDHVYTQQPSANAQDRKHTAFT